MKKFIVMSMLALTSCTGYVIETSSAAATTPDPCLPFWDAPEAKAPQASCVTFPYSDRWPGQPGTESYCTMANGDMWDIYPPTSQDPSGTKIKFENAGMGRQLCYVRNGMIIYRLGDKVP